MPKPSPVRPAVTWADLVHIQDTHGIRSVKNKKSERSPDATLLHAVYAAWVEREGLKPGPSYVMPMHLLTGHVRQALIKQDGANPSKLGLRAWLVNVLNETGCDLEIAQRPYHGRSSAA